jgi:hypothetical protein
MARLVRPVSGGRGGWRLAVFGATSAAVVAALGLGLSAALAGVPTPVLAASPASSLSSPFELATGASQKVTFTNTGGASTGALVVGLVKSPSSAGFVISQNLCAGVALGPKKTCTVTVSLPAPAPTSKETSTLTVMSKKPLVSAMAYFSANTPPTAVSDSFSLTEVSGQTYPLTYTTGNVLSNDSDTDGDTLSVASLDGNALSGGHYTETLADGNQLTLNSNGSFTYKMNNPINGSDVFHYANSDGTYSSNSASITFNVSDTAPIANPDTFNLLANTSGQMLGNVLANDIAGGGTSLVVSSVNGDALSGGSITLSTTHGSLKVNSDGSVTYTPNSNFVGTDSFSYTASDGLLDSNTVKDTIQVNDPQLTTQPVPELDIQSGAAITPFDVSPYFGGGIQPYTFTATGLPTGLAIDTSTGIITGTTTAAPGFYNVQLQVTDAYWQTILNTFTIQVTNPPLQISTSQQPASVTVGASIADKATLTGGNSPSGTVTFNLYNNPLAVGTPLFTDTETLSGGSATSKSYSPAGIGTLYWFATYNGDGNNSIISTPAAEPVTINIASPGITTSQQPASAIVGATIADKATVSGGYNTDGSTVTFNLYGNPTASGTPLFTDTETLGGGTATSKSYTTTAIGTLYWVATYNGDGNNNPASSGVADEPVAITDTTSVQPVTPSPLDDEVGSNVNGNLITDAGIGWASGNPAVVNDATFDLAASTSGLTAVTIPSLSGFEFLDIYASSTHDTAHLVLSLEVNLATGAYTATNGADAELLASDATVVFDYQVGDGLGATANNTLTVTIQADSSNPMLFGIESTAASYTTGGIAAQITSTLTVSDTDDFPEMTGATVAITSGFDSGQDTLNFSSQNGIVGSYSAGVLTLSGTATIADYQTALQSVTFSSGSAISGTRTITFSVTDGTNTSNTVSRDISVTAT